MFPRLAIRVEDFEHLGLHGFPQGEGPQGVVRPPWYGDLFPRLPHLSHLYPQWNQCLYPSKSWLLKTLCLCIDLTTH